MTELGYPPVILDIIEEHFAELDFLLEIRESVIFAPDWNLLELAELEERAEAHLDGLRLAEAHAIDIARPALGGEETFAAAAAAHVLMAANDPGLADEVLRALVDAPTPETRSGIRLALRHASIAPLVEALGEIAGSEDLALAVAAADVLSFQRSAVPDAARLIAAEELADRMLAWGVLGRLREVTSPAELRATLARDDSFVCTAALRAAARSGMQGLQVLCRAAALDKDAPSLEALGFLGLFGAAEDLPLLQAGARDEECAHVAIAALGALGRLPAIPGLIDIMREDEALAPLAAEAFKRISGVDDIAAEKAPPAPIDETDIEAEFADDTPPPDPDLAEAWWREQGEALDAESRWLGGADVSDPSEFGLLIREASMENRRDLVLCAAAQGIPGAAEFEFEALAVRQGF